MPLTMSPYASSTMPIVSIAPGRKVTSGGTRAGSGRTGEPVSDREKDERRHERRSHHGQRHREHRAVPVEDLERRPRSLRGRRGGEQFSSAGAAASRVRR